MKEYFSEEVQNKIKGLLWPDWLYLISEDVSIDFSQLFLDVELRKKDNHENYLIGKNKLNGAIFFQAPKEIENFSIEFKYNSNSKKSIIDDRETGLDFRASVNPIKSEFYQGYYNKILYIMTNDLPLELSFNTKENVDFIIFPEMFNTVTKNKDVISNRDNLNYFKENSANGWDAIDFIIIDEYTFRIYCTSLPYKENIDFEDLIVDITLSEKIENCSLRYRDIW